MLLNHSLVCIEHYNGIAKDIKSGIQQVLNPSALTQGINLRQLAHKKPSPGKTLIRHFPGSQTQITSVFRLRGALSVASQAGRRSRQTHYSSYNGIL